MQETKNGLIYIATLCAFLFCAPLFSQGTVKGFIQSKSSGEAVMFASVSLEGTSYGIITDVSGFYSLSKVPEGEYTLVKSSIEYENIKEIIYIKSGKVLTKKLFT